METSTMKRTAMKPTTESAAPGIRLEDFPPYIAERDKLNGLLETKSALDLVIQRTAETMQVAGIENQAKAVLAGANVGNLAVSQGLRPDLEQARHESAVLASAIQSQRLIVERETNRAALTIRERRKPEHVAIAKRIEAALLELKKCLDAEEVFCGELYRSGVPFAAPLIGVGFPWGILAEWFDGKSEYGIEGVSSNA